MNQQYDTERYAAGVRRFEQDPWVQHNPHSPLQGMYSRFDVPTESGIQPYRADLVPAWSVGEHPHLGPSYHFEFENQGVPENSHGITGTGGSPRVMGHISSLLVDSINRHQPATIMFTAREPSRKKLYHFLAGRVSRHVDNYVPYAWGATEESPGRNPQAANGFALVHKEYAPEFEKRIASRQNRIERIEPSSRDASDSTTTRYSWYASFLRSAGLEPKPYEQWAGVERYTQTAVPLHEMTAAEAIAAGHQYPEWSCAVSNAFRDERIPEDHPAYKSLTETPHGHFGGVPWVGKRVAIVAPHGRFFGTVESAIPRGVVIRHPDGTTSKQSHDTLVPIEEWVADRTKRGRSVPAEAQQLMGESPAKYSTAEQVPDESREQGPAFTLKKTKRGDGFYYGIMVGKQRVGHIGGFEQPYHSLRDGNGNFLLDGDGKRRMLGEHFEVTNTEVDPQFRGTGLYQRAVKQVAEMYPSGLRSDKNQSSLALHRALRKMPEIQEAPSAFLVPGSDGPHEFLPLGSSSREFWGREYPEAKPPQRYSMTAAEIDEAVKGWKEPSEAQKEAGNYRKPTIWWNGLRLKIENPRGTVRKEGWSPLAHHYGYLSRTEGSDSDAVDCFLCSHPESEIVFVVDQEHPSGRWDEHKVILGCRNEAEARKAYLANYPDGWRCGPITALTVPQFKAWLEHGDTTQRIAGQVSRYTQPGTPERYNAEEAIVKGFKAAVKDLPDDGILDLWYDMDQDRAVINAGDWVEKSLLSRWKAAASRFAEDVKVLDESGGPPHDGEWITIYRQPGAPDRYVEHPAVNQDHPDHPKFKQWFGQSKVIDPETGTPLRLYHGTPTPDFDAFKHSRRQGMGGAMGFWFSSTPEAANQFATQRFADRGPAVIPVHLRVENPMVFDNWEHYVRTVNGRPGATLEHRMKSLRRAAIKAGHDGAVVRGSDSDGGGVRDDWVVFEPHQIKSATTNSSWNRDDPRIAYSAGGQPERYAYPPDEQRGIIAVDLDGTLARYDHWQGEYHIGEPIPEMVNRVKQWLAAGRDVRIFTARVYGPDAESKRRVIEDWCRRYIGRVLPITCQKDPAMTEIWDDRAIQVLKNTGQPVKFAQDGEPGRYDADGDRDFERKHPREDDGTFTRKEIWHQTRSEYHAAVRGERGYSVAKANREYWTAVGEALECGDPVPEHVKAEYQRVIESEPEETKDDAGKTATEPATAAAKPAEPVAAGEREGPAGRSGVEKLHGGRADGIPESEFDPSALARGIEEESEHSTDRQVASEIARDHLESDPRYYDRPDRKTAVYSLAKSLYAAYYDRMLALQGPERYAQRMGTTDTPEFRKWFGGSVVRHPKTGQPLTVYHGSSGEIPQFSQSTRGFGHAFFAENPAVAGRYAFASGLTKSRSLSGVAKEWQRRAENGETARQPSITPVHLKIERPIPDDASLRDLFDGDRSAAQQAIYNWSPSLAERHQSYEDEGGHMNDDEWWDDVQKHLQNNAFVEHEHTSLSNRPNWRAMFELAGTDAGIMDRLKKQWDGYIYDDAETKDRTYVVFSPDQVKSKFNPRPTSDPRIAYAQQQEPERYAGIQGDTAMQPDPLGHATADEQGIHWETGKPVKFPYIHNTQRSPRMGARFGQDLEPHGRYVQYHSHPDPAGLAPNLQSGYVEFRNPLVLYHHPTDIYGPDGWKSRLSRAYGGKVGKRLTNSLVKDGYDGVVTVDPRYNVSSEIVDLTMFHHR